MVGLYRDGQSRLGRAYPYDGVEEKFTGNHGGWNTFATASGS